MKLFHITNWEKIPKKCGESFTLKPGRHNAEGVGVYFSQESSRPTAADGTTSGTCAALIEIEAQGNEGWWKTKNFICRKHGRPRTFHSDKKSLICTILSISGWGKLTCSWGWA